MVADLPDNVNQKKAAKQTSIEDMMALIQKRQNAEAGVVDESQAEETDTTA